ncbi:hypothetical protein PM082_015634 [Marasmius tenuissimus]|nr:hypothetical protein PM082_015634 [Marasmius tenuissimus]
MQPAFVANVPGVANVCNGPPAAFMIHCSSFFFSSLCSVVDPTGGVRLFYEVGANSTTFVNLLKWFRKSVNYNGKLKVYVPARRSQPCLSKLVRLRH